MKYLLTLLLFLTNIYGADIAIVKKLSGNVSAKTPQETHMLTLGEHLSDNMIIITKENSTVTIIFNDNSTLILGENSLLNLKKFVFKPMSQEYEFKLFLQKGSLSFESGKIGELSPQSFELKVPEGVVAIRGTKFLVMVQ